MPVIRSSLDLWQYEGVALLQQPVSINLTKRNVKHKVQLQNILKVCIFFQLLHTKSL